MKVSQEVIISVLAPFNPWWRGEVLSDLPKWRRAAYHELHSWLSTPPAPRAVLLAGARQIGKTTLMLQAIEALLRAGVPPADILYATFDHPLLKLAGLDAVLGAWRGCRPLWTAESPEPKSCASRRRCCAIGWAPPDTGPIWT